MKCPECGSRALVKQTRAEPDGVAHRGEQAVPLWRMRRRYHCSKSTCPCRFSTVEAVEKNHTYRPKGLK